ncbi:MAG: transporter substrate-binding domain-containing protein [Peptococcaceae bacterium]|nr:transporter substrate-binding domain-containing protein [Candidatus Syntrophopropionicum ammoniitolerans]
MKRLVPIIFILIAAVLIVSGCGKKETNELVVGMELAYPPFETKDEYGNPTGVSVDLAGAFGEFADRAVKIENISWDGLIPALQAGKVDAVISSMTITEERKKKIDFSKPYAKSLLALLVNSETNINKAEDLDQEGKNVAVKTGSTGQIYAERTLKKASIVPFPDESACVMEVVQGKADAFIYDQLTIYRNNLKNPETTKAVFIPFQGVEYWGVGVKKGNQELLNQLNTFIDQFYAQNGFDTITEKYLREEKATFDENGFAWFFSDLDK